MSKQAGRKIDGHLNLAINRFQLNRPKRIGKTDDAISAAIPTSLEEWQEHYISNLRSEQQLDEIGDELFDKMQSVVLAEIKSINQEDCRNYVKELVFVKTFEGYQARLDILQNELLEKTGKHFEFKADHNNDWRFKTYQIDFYHIDINKDLLIGVKVYPESFENSQNPHVIRSKDEVERAHKDAEEKYAGHFFNLYYRKHSKDKYELTNPKVLDIIKKL